jgi:catechol 2,3-dioxygenase-like lactoylglutathione lyase family enzyme
MAGKARAVGINHIALEVGDIEKALAFYGAFLEFTLRSKSDTAAFIDLGDQFINLTKAAEQPKDRHRHFGLVVTDKDAVRAKVEEMGVEMASSRFLDFYDPWGNRVEIVPYENIQFSKTRDVLRGMGLEGLSKNENARQQLRDKGMGPEQS